MTKIVNVSPSVDSSVKLQSIIDSTGNIPSKFIFSPDHEIEITSLIKVYNFAEWDGQGCKFNLMENAPVSPFASGIPLIAPKNPKSAEGLCFHDIKFDGRRDTQSKVPLKNGKNWGLGYHNFFMLGSLNSVSTDNSRNCLFYNLEFNNSLGDGIRVEGGTGITVHDIKGRRGGHDIICCAGARDIDIYNVEADTAVNAGVRFRSVRNGKIHGCKLNGTAINTGPLIQVQNTAANWHCQNIEVYDNYLNSSLGPAIWAMGTTGINDISIHNNLFYNCGLEPAAIQTDDVGGICVDGFNSTIEYNTFDQCRGFGVVFSGWQTSSTIAGLKSAVSRNIITNTKKSYFVGTASGTGIANLTGSRNSVSCVENCTFGNISDYYGVSAASKINQDPEYLADYRLKESSPCRFANYQLGRYNGTEIPVEVPADTPAFLVFECSEDEYQILKQTYPERTILKRL
jgi:hypothetical protein